MMDKMQNKPDALPRSNNIPKSGKSPRVIRNFRKYGFADSDGNIIISCVYDSARPFREGMAAVKYHEKWGFVNESGEQVIPFIYDCVWPFRKGVALVEKMGDGFRSTNPGISLYLVSATGRGIFLRA